MVLVPEKSSFNATKDVLDWAKKENKPVTASVSVTAGAVDLVMRGIGKSTGITVTPIPHAGGNQALTTLMGEQTMIGGGHPSEIIPQMKAHYSLLIKQVSRVQIDDERHSALSALGTSIQTVRNQPANAPAPTSPSVQPTRARTRPRAA